MGRIKKAEKLSELIVKYGRGDISDERADLIAYRYYKKKPGGIMGFFDRIRPDHTSMSQLANNIAISERLSMGLRISR